MKTRVQWEWKGASGEFHPVGGLRHETRPSCQPECELADLGPSTFVELNCPAEGHPDREIRAIRCEKCGGLIVYGDDQVDELLPQIAQARTEREEGRPIRVWPRREPAPPTLTPLEFAGLRLVTHVLVCNASPPCRIRLEEDKVIEGFKPVLAIVHGWDLCAMGKAYLATLEPLRSAIPPEETK